MSSDQHLYRAALWISDLLTRSVTITIATIAIATFGLSMLSGRIDVRRGLAAIVGCFILLGAASIATGLRSFVTDPSHGQMASSAPPPPSAVPAHPPDYDPYAGAALGKH